VRRALAAAALAASLFGGAGSAGASTASSVLNVSVLGQDVTDFCSLLGVSCAYAYSIHQRLVVGNTKPATLTRLSDGATFDLSYSGPTFKVDPAAAEAFCLANGGTTTARTFTTQYNDCGVSAIYNQAGPVASGGECDALQPIAIDMPIFQVRLSDGEPELDEAENLPGGSSPGHIAHPGAHWLRAQALVVPVSVTGCIMTANGSPRTLIVNSSNEYFNNFGARLGQGEDPNASGPAGAMFSVIWWNPSPGVYNTGVDVEASISCAAPISPTPIADALVISSYSGTAANVQNTWYNGVQVVSNCAPTEPINTGAAINIGCEGDESNCGLYTFRDMVILKNDVAETPGLPAVIFNYISSL
jgi:hypothetical protein